MADDEKTPLVKAIEDRMDELAIWTRADLVKRSGTSPKTVNKLLSGGRLERADAIGKITQALGWTADSFARIEAGQDPQPLVVTAAVQFTAVERPVGMGELLEAVAELRESFDRLAGRFDEQFGESPR